MVRILIGVPLLFVLIIGVIVFSLRLSWVLMNARKYMKAEMKRAYDASERRHWKRELRRLYIGCVPVLGAWILKMMKKKR